MFLVELEAAGTTPEITFANGEEVPQHQVRVHLHPVSWCFNMFNARCDCLRPWHVFILGGGWFGDPQLRNHCRWSLRRTRCKLFQWKIVFQPLSKKSDGFKDLWLGQPSPAKFFWPKIRGVFEVHLRCFCGLPHQLLLGSHRRSLQQIGEGRNQTSHVHCLNFWPCCAWDKDFKLMSLRVSRKWLQWLVSCKDTVRDSTWNQFKHSWTIGSQDPDVTMWWNSSFVLHSVWHWSCTSGSFKAKAWNALLFRSGTRNRTTRLSEIIFCRTLRHAIEQVLGNCKEDYPSFRRQGWFTHKLHVQWPI